MAFSKKKSSTSDTELELLQKRGSDTTSKSVVINIPATSKGGGLSKKKASKSWNNGSNVKLPKPDRISNSRLLNAVLSGDHISVRMAIISGENVNASIGEDQLTVLHFAVTMGDLRIVETLLQCNANPLAEDRIGRTPFFIATVLGNNPCLSAMIKAGADPNVKINLKTHSFAEPSGADSFLSSVADTIKIPKLIWDGSTALHEACRANSPDCVKVLLNAGADVEATDKNEATPLLLAGAGLDASQTEAIARYEQVVELLLKKGANGNVSSDGMAISALLNAVFLRSVPALKNLMDNGADPTWSSENGGSTTAIHEAAGNGSVDMLKVLICHNIDMQHKRALANVADAVKRTPLHKAAYAGSRECVFLLLECGADLSLKTCTGISAVEAIMTHIPDSKAFLSLILDSCVTCNSPSPYNRDFAVWLNFSLLTPEGHGKQTAVLNAGMTANNIPSEYRRHFLLHPLVEAFLRFKWSELRKYFAVLVALYAIFVINLSIYVTLVLMNSTQLLGHRELYLKISRYSTFLFASLVFLSVISQCSIHFQYYLRQWETWASGLSSIVTIIWMISEEFLVKKDAESAAWVHHLISISLPIAWAGLMLLLGRFPMWGSRALLFSVVLKNVIWTFLVMGCIIIGFSLSFFVQFHKVNPNAFGDPWRAFFNTIVMMTGEYEYLDIFNNSDVLLSITSRLLFFIFIIMVSIVLLNLIVGLAVTDTQSMNTESEARSLYKRAEFVDLLECMFSKIARCSALNKNVKIRIYGSPHDKSHAKSKILPDKLLDSLANIALNQRNRKCSDEIISAILPLSCPGRNSGSLENQISTIIENFTSALMEVIRKDKDAEAKVLSTVRRNLSSYSSTSYNSVADQHIITRRT